MKHGGKAALAAFLAGPACWLIPGGAMAQMGVSATGDDFAPIGIRAGAFFLFPQITVQGEWNDNVFKTDGNQEDDYVVRVSPEIQARSTWSRHALSAYAGAEIGRFAEYDSEDYEEYTVGFDGRIDVRRATNLVGGASFNHAYDDRSSEGTTGLIAPTPFNQTEAYAGINQRFNRVFAQLTGRYENFDYDDVGLREGGIQNNDDRDRDGYTVNARVGYDVNPSSSVYVGGSYNWREYKDDFDDAGFNRDSEGYEVGAGTIIDFNQITSAEAFVGYRAQDYDDDRLDSIEAISYGLQLNSAVTRLTDVYVSADRSVNESSLNGVGGVLTDSFGAGVSHELRRNVILSADATYFTSDYETIDRDEDGWSVEVGGKYLLNRHLYLGAFYGYETQDSSGERSGEDYDQNRVMIRLSTQL